MKKIIKEILESNTFLRKLALAIYIPTIGKYKYKKRNKVFRENAALALSAMDDVIRKQLSLEYWLDFGTLLGAVRDKTFIEHDEDLDIGMWLSDYSPKLEDALKRKGFKKIKEFTILGDNDALEQTYNIYGIDFDIFFYKKLENNRIYCHAFYPLEGMSRDKTIKIRGGLVPERLTLPFLGIHEINFSGGIYPVPINEQEYLSSVYGEHFMIKDPNWKWDSTKNNNTEKLYDKLGIRKLYD